MLKTVILLSTAITLQLSAYGQVTPGDTTFLKRETKNGQYHAVFIDPDPGSPYYSRICNFAYGRFDTANYLSSLSYLKEQNPEPLKKYDFGNLPRQWCQLYSYNDGFYLYSPSDYMFNYLIDISDTTYIEYLLDGPTANRINSFTPVDTNTYKFNLGSYNQPERILIIHLIDPQRGIAVFEKPAAAPAYRYWLMVSADKAKQFPIIVNYCKTSKSAEYKFINPDFEAMLKAR